MTNLKHFFIMFTDFEEGNPDQYIQSRQFNELIDIFKTFGYQLSYAPVPGRNYDGVLIINDLTIKELNISVKKGNVFALMQEPGTPILNNFMYKNLAQYDVVFSSVKSVPQVKLSPTYISWSLNQSIHDLSNSSFPVKNKLLSCVMSNAKFLSGHRKRLSFLKKLKQITTLDHFGRGFNPVESKGEALLNYYYSIAIENTSKDYYFTEKINDCFVCYTIPLYHGCTNIDKFFPPQSYIKINIDDVKSVARIINEELNEANYQERLPYLKEARELVLKKYHYQSLFKNEIMPVLEKNKNQPFVKQTLKKTKPNLILLLVIILSKLKIMLQKFLSR